MSGYVFISHAREDREYVEKLAEFLSSEGIDLWYDAELMPGSESHRVLRKIERLLTGRSAI